MEDVEAVAMPQEAVRVSVNVVPPVVIVVAEYSVVVPAVGSLAENQMRTGLGISLPGTVVVNVLTSVTVAPLPPRISVVEYEITVAAIKMSTHISFGQV